MSLLSASRLADAPPFAGLGEAERAELADAFLPRHFADGAAGWVEARAEDEAKAKGWIG